MSERRLHHGGFALAEALVALLILSLGLLALMQMQSQLALHSAVARDQALAASWAQQTLEQVRAASQPEASGQDEPAPGRQRRWQRVDSEIAVQVQWQDREGQTARLQLHSVLAPRDAERAALLMSPLSTAALGAEGRPVAVPPNAQRLLNSHWQRAHQPSLPGEGGAWLVFDGRTGDVAYRCANPPADETALSECLAVAARFLHGSVVVDGDITLRDLNVLLDQGGTAPCARVNEGGVVRFSCMVPIADHDQRPRTPPTWSGRLQWSAGTGVTVCRHAHNASSADGQYTHVAHTLFHQNHVLSSTQGCPPGTQP
jgi:Tfp pilus assembly protein PilV